MEPKDIIHNICQNYIVDLEDVSPALLDKIDGFRRSKNIAGLASCSSSFDRALHSVDDFRALRQIEAFYKKNALFANADTCTQAASDSFFKSEAECGSTNRRLRPFVKSKALLAPEMYGWVRSMERYINNVLGDFETFRVAIPDLVRVTPGATSNTRRYDSLPQLKMRMRLFCTNRAKRYLWALYRLHGFRDLRTITTYTNRIELVPKNWKTDRTIACEPEGNLPLQLAFDSYAKRRLRRVGIDLRDQSSNKRLAKEASIHNDYVTVDFSRASDTISYNTVALLFDEQWFAYLQDVRSPGYRGVFGPGVYRKFSSMGNGSTFCIETLLFAAACYAVGGDRDFLVYGDDVIIRKEVYENYLKLTRFLGFTINSDKTFAEGPFRESCGGDYYNGIDVTPKYIKGLDKRKASLCHLVNTMGYIANAGGRLESFIQSIIKDNKLPYVPYNESTMSGVWIDPDIARSNGLLTRCNRLPTRLRGAQIDYYRAYVPKTRKRCFVDSRGYYLWFLNKNSQVLFGGPWAIARNVPQVKTSEVPIFEHKYVRKWVCWVKPVDGMPGHLYIR